MEQQIIAMVNENVKKSEIMKKFNIKTYYELNKILINNNCFKIGKYKRKNNLNHDFLENIDTEEKAYFLGIIASDGFITSDGKIGISINSNDEELLVKIKKAIDYDGKIHRYISNSGFSHNCEYSKLIFRSNKIYKKLIEFGITINKSNELYMNYNMIPKDLLKHFIRGYFDGDGSLTKTKKDNRFVRKVVFLGLPDFIKFIEDYFNIHNLKKYKRSKTSDILTLSIAKKEDVKRILNEMYKDSKIYLERKFKRYKEFICCL